MLSLAATQIGYAKVQRKMAWPRRLLFLHGQVRIVFTLTSKANSHIQPIKCCNKDEPMDPCETYTVPQS
jgi:hypothetical protein